jgi:hypothetical protein
MTVVTGPLLIFVPLHCATNVAFIQTLCLSKSNCSDDRDAISLFYGNDLANTLQLPQPAPLSDHMCLQFTWQGMKLINCLPIKFVACHVTMNSSSKETPATTGALFALKLSKRRARYSFHFGSHMEIQYELRRFGIETGGEEFPVDLNGFLDLNRHAAWVRLRQESELPSSQENHLQPQSQGLFFSPFQHDFIPCTMAAITTQERQRIHNCHESSVVVETRNKLPTTTERAGTQEGIINSKHSEELIESKHSSIAAVLRYQQTTDKRYAGLNSMTGAGFTKRRPSDSSSSSSISDTSSNSSSRSPSCASMIMWEKQRPQQVDKPKGKAQQKRVEKPVEPNSNDVLFGRGLYTQRHPGMYIQICGRICHTKSPTSFISLSFVQNLLLSGNVMFRQLLEQNCDAYDSAANDVEKRVVVDSLHHHMVTVLGVRFLKTSQEDGLSWIVQDDKKAIYQKFGQTFRSIRAANRRLEKQRMVQQHWQELPPPRATIQPPPPQALFIGHKQELNRPEERHSEASQQRIWTLQRQEEPMSHSQPQQSQQHQNTQEELSDDWWPF